MDNGLCDRCTFQQEVRTGRGSRFSLCRRSREDDAFPKYPRVPVLRCPGFEPRPPRGAGAGGRDPGARGPTG